MHASDLLKGGDAAQAMKSMTEIRDTGRGELVERDLTTKTGETIPHEGRGVRVTDADGDLLGIAGIARDVSDRKRRKQELEARSAAIETAIDGIAILDEHGEYTYVNQAHADVYGYDSPDAFIGDTWRMCYSEDELASIEETVLPTLEENGEWRGELTGQRRDGTHFSQEVTISIRDDGGMVCVVRDITQQKQRERELERNKDLFEQTQRMTHVGGWELDIHNDELRWTDEVYRIHGLPLDYEPTLEDALDYYHPEDAPVLKTAVERAIERGEDYDLECRLVTANDTLRWVRARGEPRQKADETVMLRGTVQDITDRKEREQELQSTSALLSTLVENIPAGIFAEDSARQVLFTNEEFTDLFGIDAPPDALVESDCEAAAEGVKDHFVEAERFIDSTNDAAADHASIRREEFELVDGRTFERSGTPVQFDDEETGYLWVYHDITDRKRAESRFRALFENLPDPAVIVELTEDDALTRAVNAAFEDVFGYPAETVVDASLNDLIVPPEYEDESEQIDQQARSGDQLIREVRRQTADGELRDFLFRNVLIENVEGEPRAHGIYTDITDRKQRERRLNALHEATRELMAADTRHEIAEIASQAARDILDLPLNGVHLYDEATNGLVPLAASPKTREIVGNPPTFRAGEGIAWQVFESGDPQIYADVRSAPAVHDPETPIRSELHLPISDHGIFLLGSTVVDDFDETDISLAKVLAANVGIALDRADRVQALHTREQAVAALHDATRRLMDARTEQEIATIALEAAEDTLDFPLVSIRELDTNDAGERRLVPVETSDAAHELLGGSEVIHEGEGLAWDSLETGDPCVYGNVNDRQGAVNAGTGVRSLMVLPVADYGTINAASTLATDFDDSDVYLARILAANVESAIDRARREQELRNREEELQRQNDRLDEFAGVVSHDLRNPLNVAQGHLDLATETGEPDHFEAIARAHDRMQRIIEDVLTLARQGDAVGETQPITLDSVARTAWENVDTRTATLTADTDRTIDGDASRVSQLFENLFRNTIEHGSEEVTVRVGWLADRAGFYVEDTGPGIPPEDRTRIFESGFTTETEGTGFGLAIVSEIAVAHGWEIEATEGADGGARFEIVTEPETN